MQNVALMTRPLRFSPGCSIRGSSGGNEGESAVKLKRRSKSMPDDAFLAACTGEAIPDNSVGSSCAPGRLAKYDGTSLEEKSMAGVALVAWAYASFSRAFNPGPTSTGFGWPSGT